MSILPNWRTVSSTTLGGSPMLAASAWTACTSPPKSRISWAVLSRSWRPRAQIKTRAPSAASSRATPLPMPRLAAVTKAALPVKPRSMAYPPKQPTGSDVALRKLDSDDVEGRADKLVCVDNEVWIGSEVQVGLLGIHAVILGQPVHHANEGSVQCPIHAAAIPRAVHLDEAAGVSIRSTPGIRFFSITWQRTVVSMALSSAIPVYSLSP